MDLGSMILLTLMLFYTKISSHANGWLALCPAAPVELSSSWFTSDYWQQKKSIEGSSKGRHTTWFIGYQQAHWVLRHYWRGGLMAKLSKDSYLFTGVNRTRAVAELNLLGQLYNEKFPVPKPIAAQITKKGLFYAGDIIIERIPDAQDLVAVLSRSQMTQQQWQALGKCIAKFHQRGVYHADLNAKNILLSPKGFYLIDFDRGKLLTPHSRWQKANLDRLHRSFVKEKSKQADLSFSEINWQTLVAGYQAVVNQS